MNRHSLNLAQIAGSVGGMGVEKKPRRTEPAEVRHAQIVDAAKACFIRSGFAVTKMADIAERAGVSVGLLYRYFPNKEALIKEIVVAENRKQTELITGFIADSSGDIAAIFKELLSRFEHDYLDNDRVVLIFEIFNEIIRNESLKSTIWKIESENGRILAEKFSHFNKSELDLSEIQEKIQMVTALMNGLALQLSLHQGIQEDKMMGRLLRTALFIMADHGE